MSQAELMLAVTGSALGVAFGAAAQRTHFCIMGGIADAVLFGSLRRVRVWSLAAGTALLAIQALVVAGLLMVPGAAPGVATSLVTASGGLAFGFGMVLAGGCTSRALVRLGSGSVKGLVVVLVTGVAAAATSGWLGGLLATSGDAAIMAPSFGRTTVALVLAAALLAFALRERACRRRSPETAVALVLASAVTLGWLVTATLEPGAATSLNYGAPAGAALSWAMGAGPLWPGFAVTAVLGTLAGAFAAAAAGGRLRLELFADRGDTLRHLAGAVLMGCGGVLAGGCTIGQGVSGLAALAPTAFVAAATIVGGAVWALKYLETGRLVPWLGRADAADAADEAAWRR